MGTVPIAFWITYLTCLHKNIKDVPFFLQWGRQYDLIFAAEEKNEEHRY